MTSARVGFAGAGRWGLAALPLAFLVVFFVWPVAAILGRGLWIDGLLDLRAFVDRKSTRLNSSHRL